MFSWYWSWPRASLCAKATSRPRGSCPAFSFRAAKVSSSIRASPLTMSSSVRPPRAALSMPRSLRNASVFGAYSRPLNPRRPSSPNRSSTCFSWSLNWESSPSLLLSCLPWSLKSRAMALARSAFAWAAACCSGLSLAHSSGVSVFSVSLRSAFSRAMRLASRAPSRAFTLYWSATFCTICARCCAGSSVEPPSLRLIIPAAPSLSRLPHTSFMTVS